MIELFANGQVATQYVDYNGNLAHGRRVEYERFLCSNRRYHKPRWHDVYGKMAHSERIGDVSVAINIYGEQDLKLFESGVKYFK